MFLGGYDRRIWNAHGGLCQLDNVPPNVDATGTPLAVHVNVQEAPPADFGSLLANEACTITALSEAVFHHKKR